MLANQKTKQFALSTLLLANIITIILFIVNDGSVMQALWVYWLQSVIIGIFTVARIITLPTNFSLSGLPKKASNTTRRIWKIIIAGGFVFQYGIAHIVYAVFLSVMQHGEITGLEEQPFSMGGEVALVPVLVAGLVFALHHWLSYRSEQAQNISDTHTILAVKNILVRPYARIAPLHIIIIVGPLVAALIGYSSVFIVFMILKTVADLRLHMRGTSHLDRLLRSQTQGSHTPAGIRFVR